MWLIKKRLLKSWPAIRARGRWRFVIWYGVVRWGAGTAVGATAMMWLFSRQDPLRFAAIALCIFPVGGILVGLDLWNQCDREAPK
jgi:uncharacterized membrane protein